MGRLCLFCSVELVAARDWFRGVYDDDGAGGVVDALLADGAEQKAGEPAMAAGADNQQIRPRGGTDEDFCGKTLDNPTFDLDARCFLPNVDESPLEQVFSRSVEIAQAGSEQGVGAARALPRRVALDAAADVAVHPGVDSPYR